MENWFIDYFDQDYIWLLSLKDDPERTAQQVDFVSRITSLTKDEGILDLGCGYGRHILLFSKAGYVATGLDLNKTYLEEGLKRSRELNLSINLVEGDMRKLPFSDEQFTLVTSFFTTFGYFSEEDNLKVLKEAYRVLKTGGFIFLDLENRDHIIKYFKTDMIREYPSFLMLERHNFDIINGVQRTKRIYIKDGKQKEVRRELRLYTLTELKWLLEKTGFHFTSVYGDYCGGEFNLETPRMLVFAQKVEFCNNNGS